MRALRHGRLLLMSVILLPSTEVFAVSIDFQTPDLGTTSLAIIDPYEAEGVIFTDPAGDGPMLVRESLYSDCVAPDDPNQYLLAAPYWPPPLNGNFYVRADFPPDPAEPVHWVSTAVVGGGPLVSLRLYDEVGVVLAESQGLVAGCGDPRLVLVASSASPVAYATISSSQLPGSECGGSCMTIAAIDDFRFENHAVARARRSWGSLKARYR